MIGGFDFARSKFNRATQAWRQMGSTFKPIVYTAAIDRGYTPASIIVDAPVAYPAGPNQPLYSPQNYDRKFEGPVTLRRALEQSRNIPTVKLLDSIGPAVAIDYAKRFGFTSKFQPYLSLALGATEATLLDATSAYTAFPHQGVRMRPYEVLRVVDRQGNLLEENRPEPHDAIRADTAFVMTNLLRGVDDAWHGCRRGGARLAGRRQDGNDGRVHGCVVHRLRSRHHDRRLDWLRREEVARDAARPAPPRRCRSGSTS